VINAEIKAASKPLKKPAGPPIFGDLGTAKKRVRLWRRRGGGRLRLSGSGRGDGEGMAWGADAPFSHKKSRPWQDGFS